MITPRDEKALEFIELFQIATTHQINKVAYNNIRVCQRRLMTLANMGVIYRTPNLYTKEYLYSVKKPNLKQLKHKLLRNEFYIKMLDLADVVYCQVEKDLFGARPDATMIVVAKKTNKRFYFAVEIESSNNTINISKYEHMGMNGQKPMPIVVYVTNKKVPPVKYFKWVKVSPSLNDLEQILL